MIVFQLTASRRGWHSDRLTSFKLFSISTHSLTKRLTTCRNYSFRTIPVFQLTASRRGWHGGLKYCIEHKNFNSQPHEEADKTKGLSVSEHGYFNSQPHEEADDSNFTVYNGVNISTHSLTKRLTFLCTGNVTSVDISTHSLTKRLTLNQDWFLQEFNISTHSLTKRLTSVSSFALTFTYISTHSLTKRLTSTLHKNSAHEIFQLTASRRGWQ